MTAKPVAESAPLERDASCNTSTIRDGRSIGCTRGLGHGGVMHEHVTLHGEGELARIVASDFFPR